MDPKYNGIVALDAVVDLKGLKNEAVKIMDLPKKFVAVGMTVEQLELLDSDDSNDSLTFESKIGTSNAVTFGKAYSVNKTTLTAPAYSAAKEVAIKDASTTPVQDNIPQFALLDGAAFQVKTGSSTALKAGKVGVTVYGFADRFQAYASAGENKAPADPYTPPEKA